MFGIGSFENNTEKIAAYINKDGYRDTQKKRTEKLLLQLPPEEKEAALKVLAQEELECTGRRVLVKDLFEKNTPSTVSKVTMDELENYKIPQQFQRHFKGIFDKITRIAASPDESHLKLIESLQNKSLSSGIDNTAMQIKAGELVKNTIDAFAKLQDSTAFIVKKGFEFNSADKLKELLSTPSKWQKLLRLIK